MLDALTDREKYPAWFVPDRSPLYLYDKHKKELYKNCPNVSGIKKKQITELPHLLACHVVNDLCYKITCHDRNQAH